MTKKIKIILIALIFLLLSAAGYLFARLEKKQTRINNPGLQKVDEFAAWQTYFGRQKGFNIKIPPKWSKNYDHDGTDLRQKDKFWRDQVGEVEFLSSATAANEAKLNVLTKDSDLSSEDFSKVVFGNNVTEDILVGNLPAKRSGLESELVQGVVVKEGRRYFFLKFTSDPRTAMEDEKLWEKILSTFVVSETK